MNAPRWLEDRGGIYPPRRPLLTLSWDVKVRWYSSFIFAVGLLWLALNLVEAPCRWLRERLR